MLSLRSDQPSRFATAVTDRMTDGDRYRQAAELADQEQALAGDAEQRRAAPVGRRGARGVGAARIRRPMTLTPHTAPSRVIRSLYPWTADPGHQVPGAYIGPDLYTMGSYLFDPWELYARKVITAPNIVLLGVLGSGKSALQKSLILRLAPFGVRFSWIQVKPEYELLCAALGITPLTCGPGQLTALNPLAQVRRHPQQTVPEWHATNRTRRTTLLTGILEIGLHRTLSDLEQSVLGWALDAVTGADDPTRQHHAPVSLPTLLTAMTDPTRWGTRAVDLGIDPADALTGSQGARLGLSELVTGSLRGMFDATGPDNTAFDITAPGTVLDLSGVRHNPTLTLLAMVCAQSAMEAALLHPDAGHRLIGYDEAWLALRHLPLLLRLQEQFKLSRMFGVANLIAFHRFSDIDAVGDTGTAARTLAAGLLADADIHIAYRQAPTSLPLTQDLMGLSDVQTTLLGHLPVGVGLWKVGNQPAAIVKHQLAPQEWALINTDSRMDVTPTPDGDDDQQVAGAAGGSGERSRATDLPDRVDR